MNIRILSITLLCACAIGGFFLWKIEQDKQQQQELQARRTRFNTHYANELLNAYVCSLSVRNRIKRYIIPPPFAQQKIEIDRVENNIRMIEGDMRQDGYDSAEIGEMKRNALYQASQNSRSQATTQ